MKREHVVERDFANLGVTMAHDELVAKLGDAYKTIEAAGYVLVPRAWRERSFRAAENRNAFAPKSSDRLK